LHISQDLILKEQKEREIKENLQEYFFNDKISLLEPERRYLLSKIKEASTKGLIKDASDKTLDENKISKLSEETYLLPFFEWK
jgi:hypothetical protein